MRQFLPIFIVVALAAAAAPEIEEGVLVLTEANFDETVASTEYLLVEFYAPWCGHCKHLAPEYAKAAQKLAEEGSPIKLGKVDATVENDLASKFGVRGYPTLKFFRNGKDMEYNGGRTESTIITWLKKRTGPAAKPLASVEEADALLQDEVTIIGFFKDQESAAAKAYLEAAAQNDEYQFGITSESALFKKYNIEGDAVVLFKQFDEGKNILKDDITVDSVEKFIEDNSLPLLTEFSQKVSQKLFGDKDKPFVFLIMSKTSENFESVSQLFRSLATENKGKVKAVFLNTDDSTAVQVINYMGVKESDYPCYRLLNLEKGLKYKPEQDALTAEGVNSFFAAYLSGSLKPFLKSEEIPDNWDTQPVKILVGKNFKEVAFDKTKNVFVEFYAPWCGHCKSLAPIWDELGKMYASVENVIIAKMDSTLNEIEEVNIRGFPTLKFFPAGESSEILDYPGERTIDAFVQFLSKYAPLPAAPSNESQSAGQSEASEETADKKQKDEL